MKFRWLKSEANLFCFQLSSLFNTEKMKGKNRRRKLQTKINKENERENKLGLSEMDIGPRH